MKNLIPVIVLTIVPFFFISAQENYDKQEIGVRLNSNNEYALFYKNQIDKNKYFRLRTVNAFINISDNGSGNNAYNFGFGLAPGVETRKELTEEFDMILGFETLASVSHRKIDDSSQGNYRLGIGFVLGFSYKLTDNINVGIETIPSLIYNASYGGLRNTSFTNVGFNSSSLNFTGMYSF